jgi:hypothetical protein
MKQWFVKLGWFGFFFFLVKGLLWLLLFYFGFEFLG